MTGNLFFIVDDSPQEPKKEEYAQVIVTQSIDIDLMEPKMKYEWKGDISLPFLIAEELLDANPDLLSQLPWPVEYIGRKDIYTLIFKRIIKES